MRGYHPSASTVKATIQRLRRAPFNERPGIARRLPWSRMNETQRRVAMQLVGRKLEAPRV